MSDELIIREAIPDDANDLIEFYKMIQGYSYVETTDIPNDIEGFKHNLSMIFESPLHSIILALNDNEIIGFSNVDNGELGIVVNQDFWHFGVGTELMFDTVDWFVNNSELPELKLEVYQENIPAIGLYKKFGFESVKETDKTIIMNKKR
ncbi:N-acetyltransferase [Companilactobacillus sp. RD055328]|uniref:GNAT family N-acetyltransferase n=1 Tax=Companilactobacillus sp. RD055328 TaxID=2916634 RepID=UPI001FC84A4E|nr:GNAT family N-acetyltransferase [Companilactobacillus sp. RD055328]GKQ43009.1 N-acetyltransferase [Companilactobacillus sp. RD055328]